MSLTLVVEPVEEPLELDEVKDYLKVDHDYDDALIAELITTARIMAEKELRRALLTQTWEYSLDGVPGSYDGSYLPSDWPWSLIPAGKGYLELPLPPLQSVDSVSYYDLDNVSHTFSTSNYSVSTRSTPGKIYLNNGCVWPSELRSHESMVVKYIAGWTYPGQIPAAIRMGLKRWVAYMYQNRGDENIPIETRKLFEPYRVVRL